MNRRSRKTRGSAVRRCAFDWCVTEHGATVHPDDEDHRSAGRGAEVRVRDAGAAGEGEPDVLEAGLLRRAGDADTWVVLETGTGASISVPVGDFRAFLHAWRDDAWLSRLCGPVADLD